MEPAGERSRLALAASILAFIFIIIVAIFYMVESPAAAPQEKPTEIEVQQPTVI